MNDQFEQSDGGQRQQARLPEPDAQLTDRLLSRSAKPVGMIDTHHPRQIHARTAGWVAERFAMLDHWRTRYAGDENPAAPTWRAGGDFVLPSALRAASREKIAAAPSAPQISPLSAIPSQPPTLTPSPAESPMMRVMRRTDSPQPSPPVSNRTIDTPQPSPPVGNWASVTQGVSIADLRSTEIAQPPSGASEPLALAKADDEIIVSRTEKLIQREANESIMAAPATSAQQKIDQAGAQTAKGRLIESAGADVQPHHLPLRASELSPQSAVYGAAQRKAGETASGLARGKVISVSAADATIQRMPLSFAERTGGASGPGASSGASRPAPLIQSEQRLEQGPEQKSEQASRLGTVQTARIGGNPATTTEIPFASASAPPNIIWRKSESASSIASPRQMARNASITPGGPMIARMEETGSGSAPETITTPKPPSPSASSGPVVDVEGIADQVSRLLERQLEIERERRGR